MSNSIIIKKLRKWPILYMPNIATPTVSVVFAIPCQILDYLISDKTFKCRLSIHTQFLTKKMCFPTKSTNLSIFTHDNVDEF